MCLNVSRYRLLESRLEETVQQTMKVKEEKISTLEKKLEESGALNKTLHAELEAVRKRALAFASVKLKLCDSLTFFFPAAGSSNGVRLTSAARRSKPQLPAAPGG